jgi:protease secretion system membrane fusion protein
VPVPYLGRFQAAVSDVWNPYQPERFTADGLQPVEVQESRTRRSAAWLLLVAALIFGTWATLAPIDSGVGVPGTVVVQGHRKAVQHPKGGVVEKILVSEGATVKQGDVLVTMNPLTTEADLTNYEVQYLNLLATESRLLSERQGLPAVRWSAELEERAPDPRVKEAKAIHTQLFRSRQADLRGQQQILREQIAGLQAQVQGLRGVLESRKRQIETLAEEAKNNRRLADMGFLPRIRANETERIAAEVTGSIASTNAELAKTRTAIASTQLQLMQLQTAYFKEIDAQLSETQKSREALQSKVESLRFERSLTELRAPASGKIVGVKVHTVGGVIQPADVLMEIVPLEESLIIEARVPPGLIDKVHAGMEADLRFAAFNRATTPVIPGRVRLVGADRLKWPDAQAEYYLAQVELTPEGERMLGSLSIQPGMPVDVIVKTGERSLMSYFLKPITDRLAHAVRED